MNMVRPDYFKDLTTIEEVDAKLSELETTGAISGLIYGDAYRRRRFIQSEEGMLEIF